MCRGLGVERSCFYDLKCSHLLQEFCLFVFVSNSLRPLAAHQAFSSLRGAISRSLFKLTSIELVMPSNSLILCRPHPLPSIFPSIRVFFR